MIERKMLVDTVVAGRRFTCEIVKWESIVERGGFRRPRTLSQRLCKIDGKIVSRVDWLNMKAALTESSDA